VTSIWTHAALFGDDPGAKEASGYGITLGEGGTALEPVPALAKLCGARELFLKREDRNPSGSHKDRGLLYQVVHHAPEGGQTFVLSSSGNAAVSAAAACRATNNRLIAFVSPKTARSKMLRLVQTEAVVIVCPKPINFARYAARVFGLINLRGTKDSVSSIGYRSIAGEVSSEAPELDAFFTFSSSGISMTGIADGFDRLGCAPSLWAVQSGECLGVVRAIDPETPSDPESPAGRLGIRNPPGADQLAARLLSSGGGAIAVGSSEVRIWQQRLEDAGIKTSPEGAAVLAGVERCDGLTEASVVAVMTGRAGKLGGRASTAEAGPTHTAESYLEVRGLLEDDLGLAVV